MKIFRHRCNSRERLATTSREFGVEIDIRTWCLDLILEHDPYTEGEHLGEWLMAYQHAGLILNVKEEGLEQSLVDLLADRNISNYLFLDQSFPSMIKWLNAGYQQHIAARVSEYESMSSLKSFPYPPGHIWCDSFSGNWDHLASTVQYAADNGATLILVSPELQSRDTHSEILTILDSLSNLPFVNLAVCTKEPSLWL